MINPRTLVDINDINENLRRNTEEENNVTSSFNEISTDQLEKEGVVEGGGVTLSAPHSFPQQQASEQIFKGTQE